MIKILMIDKTTFYAKHHEVLFGGSTLMFQWEVQKCIYHIYD